MDYYAGEYIDNDIHSIRQVNRESRCNLSHNLMKGMKVMKVMNWKIAFFIFLELLFPLCLVAAVTFLVWHFNNHHLMWWYILAAVAYCSLIGSPSS